MKHRYLFGLLLVVVCSCLYLFYVIYVGVKERTIADFNSMQLIHARQAGRGIEEYLGDLMTFLVKAAEESHIIDLDDHGKNEFEFALKTGGQGIKAITRVDKTGKIIYTLPYDGAAIGRDISYQKHIQEIMSTRKSVVSDVFTAVQGYNAIAIHVPVFKGNEFRGTLAFLIDFKSISKRFLEDIRIGETGYAWMISREGIELYCPAPGHTGKSVFENVKGFPSVISMAKEMVKGGRGVAVYDFNQVREKKTETVRKRAVYMPVEIGNTYWSIVVSSNEDEILAPLENFRNKLIFVMGLLLLGSALFSYYGMRAWGIIREEAKRKKIEEALRESEERYRILFEANHAVMLIINPDNAAIVDANPAACAYYGWSREELKKMRINEINTLTGEEVFEEMQSAKTEKRSHFFFRHRRADGIIRDVEVYSGPIKHSGKILLYSIIHDITERKRIEEALRESEEKYSMTFNTSPDSVNINRLEDGLYVDVNGGFTKLTGFTREDTVGRTSLEINIWNDPADREKLVQGLREKGFYENLEARFRRKDGSIGTGLMSAKIISLNGIPHVISFTRDITERRRMEEELLKVDKLESVGILAGGIAHDFNNILAAIVGNISLALRHVKQGSRVFDLLSAAETASMRARGLTGQLLIFARGGAPVKEISSISNLISESSLFVLQGSKSICEFSIAEDLWQIEADMGQINQVISNIVINANQAMPEGGIISIAADNVTLEEEQGMQVKPGRYIRISVKDQGAGIPEKHLSKVFDPYFSTKQTGSGLGLATAYSIVRKHNGHISVDSLLGAGTTFYIYLPASDKAVPAKEEADLIKGEGKILLMDDDRMLREMAGEMLNVLGYEAEFAENGAQALEMHRKAKESGKPYSAVILDLTIPGSMGGKEAIKKLLELDPELKAIVFSGYSDDPVMSNYREYGFRGMIAKPFDLQALSRALYEVIKAENRI